MALLIVIGALAAVSSASGSGAGSIVVAQVFAAGGNSGAPYTNDYAELFNRGTSAVSLTGWTLQYASASSSTWSSTALTGSIPAGGHFLVQLASGGANGSALPAPDATGTSNFAVSGGKVQVVNAGAGVEDLVGWGSATQFEGSAAAPALTSTTALVRGGSFCTDADDNSSDFTTGTPNPLNSSASTAPCSSSGGGGGGGGGNRRRDGRRRPPARDLGRRRSRHARLRLRHARHDPGAAR